MDTRSRSLAKAFTYRFLGSVSTAGLVYMFSHDVKAAVGVGLLDSVVKITLYFLHERLWNYIPFGRPKAPEYEI